MTGGQTDGAAQPCHTFQQGSLDWTLCSKGSSQVGGPLVAVEDLGGDRGYTSCPACPPEVRGVLCRQELSAQVSWATLPGPLKKK